MRSPGCLKCNVLLGPENGDHCTHCELEIAHETIATLEAKLAAPASPRDLIWDEEALLELAKVLEQAKSAPSCAACEAPLGAKFYADAKYVMSPEGTRRRGDICLACRASLPSWKDVEEKR